MIIFQIPLLNHKRPLYKENKPLPSWAAAAPMSEEGQNTNHGYQSDKFGNYMHKRTYRLPVDKVNYLQFHSQNLQSGCRTWRVDLLDFKNSYKWTFWILTYYNPPPPHFYPFWGKKWTIWLIWGSAWHPSYGLWTWLFAYNSTMFGIWAWRTGTCSAIF